MELSRKQIKRQDFVDNSIYNLMQDLNMSKQKIDWDIEFIGEIRNIIKNRFKELNICSEEEFYPYLND